MGVEIRTPGAVRFTAAGVAENPGLPTPRDRTFWSCSASSRDMDSISWSTRSGKRRRRGKINLGLMRKRKIQFGGDKGDIERAGKFKTAVSFCHF